MKFKILHYIKNLIKKDKTISNFQPKDGNIFVYIKRNGEKLTNPNVENIKIHFGGKNNYIEIHEGVVKKLLHIETLGDNNICKIGKNPNINDLKIYLETNSEVTIGDNFSVVQAIITHTGDNGYKVIIGNDCMFSYNLVLRTTDRHTIYDIHTKELLNKSENIIIGNHVWIAARALILKGVIIPNDCIIGAGSIVTRKFSTPNCIIAGNPAKIVKQNINWNKSEIHHWDTIKENL